MPPSRSPRAPARPFEPSGAALLDPRALGRFYDPWGDRREEPFEREHGCAVVDIDGPVAQRAGWLWDGYDAIAERFQAALDDKATPAVVLRIDSPGGDAAGCFEAVRQMRAAKAASGKPVVAYASEQACSAAYALATVADAIWLPSTGEVGSIGALHVLRDRVRQNEQAGLNVQVIASGKRKAEGHPDRPLTPEVIAADQASVDRLAGLFAELVAEGRPGTRAVALLALEGASLDADGAVAAKLADKVGSFAEACAAALAMAPRAGAPRAAAQKTTTGPRAQGANRMKTVLQALGLSEDASEAEALAALHRQTGVAAKLLELTGKASAAEALGHVQGLAQAAASVDQLRAQLEEERKARLSRDVEDLFGKAKAEGRMPPALEQTLRARPVMSDDDVAFLRGLVGSLPVIPQLVAPAVKPPSGPATSGSGAAAATAGKPWGELTTEQKHNLFVEDRAAYEALRQDHLARKGR